jgi:hypothetical protein
MIHRNRLIMMMMMMMMCQRPLMPLNSLVYCQYCHKLNRVTDKLSCRRHFGGAVTFVKLKVECSC